MTTASREARIPIEDAPPEGAVRMLDVGGHRVGIYRVAGDLHALADRCPHRGARLCAGRVATPIELGTGGVTVGARNSVVRCPWHKWEFEIATGRCLVDPRLRVRRYLVRVEGDEVVVTLDRPS
jgi:nitrite reductase/ring-hydroxylating ferredoxin subunit